MSAGDRPAPGRSHLDVHSRRRDRPEAWTHRRSLGWLDERTGVARVVRAGLRKVFPDHWSFLFGEVALFCFVILVATGTYLTFFFVPSAAEVTYDGPYAPLRGRPGVGRVRLGAAHQLRVKAGLLMRQIHHWTALVFVGRDRRPPLPRLLHRRFPPAARGELDHRVHAAGAGARTGFTGYSLPDDLLSGTGLRIAYSAALSVPFIGPWVASLLVRRRVPDDRPSSAGSSCSTSCCCPAL